MALVDILHVDARAQEVRAVVLLAQDDHIRCFLYLRARSAGHIYAASEMPGLAHAKRDKPPFPNQAARRRVGAGVALTGDYCTAA